MKKLLALLLVVMMSVTLFAACGEKEDTTETTKETTENKDTASDTKEEAKEEEKEEMPAGIEAKITIAAEESWMVYFQAAIDRVLEKNPKSSIEILPFASAFDHLDIIDATDVTNTDVADVFPLPADRLYGLYNNEALAVMDAQAMAANLGGFGDYDAGLGGNFNIDGDYYVFPWNIETLINFANQANADAAGIDLTGTIEFTELGYEDMLVPAFNAWFGVALANAGDIEMLGKDADGNLFSDLTKDWADLSPKQQEVFTAIYDYWKAHDEAATDGWDGGAVWGYMDAQYATGGNTSVRLEGPWSTGSMSTHAGENMVILPINQVTVAGNPLAHWKGGWGFGINARNEGMDAEMALSQALIEELVNPMYAADLFVATGKILENVSKDEYMAMDLPENDKVVIGAVLDSYQDAPARPLFTEWGQVWSTWENGLLSWSAVKPATVEDAYKEVKASFDAMMLNF